jgi:hypothetical protein
MRVADAWSSGGILFCIGERPLLSEGVTVSQPNNRTAIDANSIAAANTSLFAVLFSEVLQPAPDKVLVNAKHLVFIECSMNCAAARSEFESLTKIFTQLAPVIPPV